MKSERRDIVACRLLGFSLRSSSLRIPRRLSNNTAPLVRCRSCPNVPTSAPTPSPSCGSGKTLYKIGQFDSWGDGWNQASMSVKDDEAEVIYEGSLEEVRKGEEKGEERSDEN